ncbi:MAG: hypothetical protein AAF432_14900 [Planctomycetota bacterium]
MTDATPQHIRLVGADDDVLAQWARARQAREAILAENHRAAAQQGLEPTDPRWVFAVRVRRSLQGSTLTPDRREHLHREAARMGIRPFDATMIIAIVQDRARRGEDLGSAVSTLTLLDTPDEPISRARDIWRWGVAIALAIVANIFLAWWLGLF